MALDRIADGLSPDVLASADEPGAVRLAAGADTQTDYYYKYELQCPGGLETMTTANDIANEGSTTAVMWDPSGQVSPRPAGDDLDPEAALRLAAVAGSGGVFLIILEAPRTTRFYSRLSASCGRIVRRARKATKR